MKAILLTVILILIASSCTVDQTSAVREPAITQGATEFVVGKSLEPSAAWSAVGSPSGKASVTVGYFDQSGTFSVMNNGVTTLGTTGWAFTDFPGINWTPHDADDPKTKISTASITDFFDWKGNAAVVADQRGHVVYIIGAHIKEANGDSKIVALLSDDGGSSFNKVPAIVVNDVGNCSDGRQDQPHATFDLTTEPPTLVVVWRHLSGGFQHGVCVRRGVVLDGPLHVAWLNNNAPPNTVNNLPKEDSFSGIGGVNVQAGDGTIYVVNTTTEHIFECPDTGKKGVGWGIVASNDGGINWSDSETIFHSDDFVWCVGGKPDHGVLEKAFRDFSFVRAASGDLYLLANDSQTTVRLFHGRGGFRNGTYKWREWCTASPGHWTRAGERCKAAWFPGQPGNPAPMLPSLAVDGQGRLFAHFYLITPGSPTTATVVALANVDPLGVTFQGPDNNVWQGAQSLEGPFNPLDTNRKARALGDYIWTTVAGRTDTPTSGGCSPTASFYPFWTAVPGQMTTAVHASLVTVTPP